MPAPGVGGVVGGCGGWVRSHGGQRITLEWLSPSIIPLYGSRGSANAVKAGGTVSLPTVPTASLQFVVLKTS